MSCGVFLNLQRLRFLWSHLIFLRCLSVLKAPGLMSRYVCPMVEHFATRESARRFCLMDFLGFLFSFFIFFFLPPDLHIPSHLQNIHLYKAESSHDQPFVGYVWKEQFEHKIILSLSYTADLVVLWNLMMNA